MIEFNFDGFNLLRFEWSFIASHMYVIRRGEEALVVDPVDTDEVRAYIKNERVKNCTVLLTHEHFDHISGVSLLRSLCGCDVICSRVCADNIRSSSNNLSDKADAIVMFNSDIFACRRHVEPFTCEADDWFEETLRFRWHDFEIDIFTAPGHSKGSVCVLLNGEYLFSGDTLLDVPTITRLPGGDREAFHRITLPRLRDLRFQVRQVFPGHGDIGTLDELLKKYDQKQ